MTHKRTALGLVGLAFVLRIVFFVGYANVDPWDDTLYLELARQVREGPTAPSGPAALVLAQGFRGRRGVYYPIAGFQSIFGPSDGSSSLYSLLCSLGTLLVTWRLAERFRPVAGLWAIAFLALFPLDLVFASRATAEAPQTFWTALLMLALVTACDERTARLRRALLAGAGLAFAVSVTTRVAGLVAAPVAFWLLAPLWRHPTRRKELLWFFGALVATLAITGGFGAFAIERGLQATLFEILPRTRFEPLPFFVLHVSYTEGTVHQFFKEAFGIVAPYPGIHLFAGYAIAGGLAILAGLFRRETRWLGLWALVVFVFFQYGFRGLSVDSEGLHYFMVAPRPRHLTLLAPALAVLLGVFAADLYRRRRLLAVVLAGAVLASGLAVAFGNRTFYRGSMADVRAVADFVARHSEPIYGDPWLVYQLPLYGVEEENVRLLGADPPSGALVALGGSRGYDVPATDVPPSTGVPEDWTEAFRRRAPASPARDSDLVIYRVP